MDAAAAADLSLWSALPFAAWWLGTRGAGGAGQLLASLEEYLSFIVLLGSLCAISGATHVAGSLPARRSRTRRCSRAARCWPT